MDIDEIRKLPPEERIKKLKELEEQRKKEIENAEKLIKESVAEITKKEERKRDIPIEQITAFSEEFLQTQEEKEMFRAKRFTGKKEGPKGNPEDNLEDTVSKEKIPKSALQAKNMDYKMPGRVEPKNLYNIIQQTTREDTLEVIKGLEGRPYHEWTSEERDAARNANYITDVGKGKINEMYAGNLSRQMLETVDEVAKEMKRLRGEYLR